MTMVRPVLAGVLLGAAVAFLAALLKPRRGPAAGGYDPAVPSSL